MQSTRPLAYHRSTLPKRLVTDRRPTISPQCVQVWKGPNPEPFTKAACACPLSGHWPEPIHKCRDGRNGCERCRTKYVCGALVRMSDQGWVGRWKGSDNTEHALLFGVA